MHKLKASWILAAAAFTLTGAMVLLWSWNTLVELFGGPIAEFRHAVAALILLGIVRLVVARGRGHRRRATHCPDPAADF